MALIKCSECGAEISSLAVSCPKCGNPMNLTEKKRVINGTEFFTVTEGSRPALAGATNGEIQVRTERLNKEGKRVINTHISEPQPIQIGFTTWTNNVTLTWEADEDDERYKSSLSGSNANSTSTSTSTSEPSTSTSPKEEWKPGPVFIAFLVILSLFLIIGSLPGLSN